MKASRGQRLGSIQKSAVNWLVALGDTLESNESHRYQTIQKTTHEASRLGKYLYLSISKELLDIDDVDNGMMLI